ncbi:LOW QUALITY PROTEIN: nuclear pore complex protein NUP1-like [Curcuma longa]|uniref:LOW QUALITY PROTEIN: nuclear pore complex protein NUP1-like n=1 Tax=Curcuma longa TaxID=136217 RepID=UPI003D9E042F
MKRKAVDEDDHYAGAGGKLTRKELRPRIAMTPYDRPALTGRRRGFGWISAPPSPAVFSPKFAASAPIKDTWPMTSKALPQSRQEDYDRPTSSRNVYADPSKDQVFGEATNTCDNSGIAEIELWLKQRTFSREQSNYLKELLQSRTRDFNDHHGETEGILNQKVSIKSQSVVLPGHLLTPKPEESLKMKVVNDVSSSPAEIAKAYMEGLVTESFHEPRKAGLKNMTAGNNALASEMAYSSVIRSPVCSPGAIVENNGSHLTPKTSRLKVEPFSSRRTPYSGSIFSKSKFQDGGERERTQPVSSSGWKKSSTALRGITVPHKYNGSTPSKELLDSNLAIFSSMPSSIPNATKNFCSTWKANYGKNSMASNLNYNIAEGSENIIYFNSVPPKSSQTAMKILEHLNKTIPSPKEKLIHANPEVVETKSFSKFATDCHAKKPVVDEEAKASLFSKGVVEEEKISEEKAVAMATMSKNGNKVLPSATPMTKDHQLPGANKKSCDAAIKVAVSGSTPLNASSKTPSTPVLTSSPTDIPFKFPVSSSTSLNASPEPSMPSLTSPVMSTMPTSAANNMPSFMFRSPCPNSGLNFSLATTSNNPTVTDTPEPQFKFGSGDQRRLSFWFRNTESELY